MSDFGFDINSLNDSASLSNKISEGHNPEGGPSLVTSASKDKYSNQTLTSRNLTDIMAGGALNRNPAAVADASSKFVKSSLDTILAIGAQAGDDFQIENPDYQGNEGESKVLKGHEAYLKAVSGSIMGTGFAPTTSVSPLFEAMDGKWPGSGTEPKVGDADGYLYTHNNIAYKIDENAPSLGERAVAIVSELSEDEKQIYLERGTLLKASINETALTLGFQFDIPDKLSSYSFNQTESYFPPSNGIVKSVDSTTISAPSTLAYVSAALIECLLMLVDPTKGVGIGGRFGLTKVLLSEDQASDKNINPEKYLDKKNKNSISDHAFGRAFDVTKVGSYTNLGKSKQIYATALDQFLSKLATLPQAIHPDLIIMHPDVAKDLGVMQGFDSAETAIRKKYPNLKYVNFESGTEHTDNIHISFSPQRAGQYMGATGWITPSSSEGSGSDGSGNYGGSMESAKQKAFTNYKTSGTSITLTELFYMLTDSEFGVFSDEAAAIMCAIAARESSTNPSSFNGKCSTGSATQWGGDWSIGMFQFNLISYIPKSGSNAEKHKVLIYFDGTSKAPKKVFASSLAYNATEAATWDPKAIALKLIELQNTGKQYTDDTLWYPANQIYMLLTKWGKSGNQQRIDSSGGFFAWGDYGDRSDCGFIFGTKFQDAVNVYVATGKDYETLVAWVRLHLPSENPKTKIYVEDWMNGEVFYSKPKDGSLKNETLSKPIVATGSSSDFESQGSSLAQPPFTKSDIQACSDWIKANRLPGWVSYFSKNNPSIVQENTMGCERYARVLAAALGLFGPAKTDLIDKPWETLDPTGSLETATGLQASGGNAEDHLNRLINNPAFHPASSDDGYDPPAGTLVFWRKVQNGPLGHVGISIGNKLYVDQHMWEPKSILDSTWPGSSYQYAGWSSAW